MRTSIEVLHIKLDRLERSVFHLRCLLFAQWVSLLLFMWFT